MKKLPKGFSTITPTHPKIAERILEVNTTDHIFSMWFSNDRKYQYREEGDGQIWGRAFDGEGFSHGKWLPINKPYRVTETGYLIQG